MYLKIEAEKVQKNLIERLFVSSYIFRFSFFYCNSIQQIYKSFLFFIFFLIFACLFRMSAQIAVVKVHLNS